MLVIIILIESNDWIMDLQRSRASPTSRIEAIDHRQ
jgi:hypothetical protein